MRLCLPDNSVDSIVTDPPYGINFMGKSWDDAQIREQTAKRMSAKNQPPNPDGSIRKNPRNAPSENAGSYDFSSKGMQHFQLWTQDWAREAFRVLKPGGHIICFASPRTYHRMTCGIEDAGFENTRSNFLGVRERISKKFERIEGDRQGSRGEAGDSGRESPT